MKNATTPHIIVNLKYHKYYSEYPNKECEKKYYENSNFYRCKKNHNVINYFTRKDAIDNYTDEEIRKIENFSQQNISPKNIIDYAANRPGSTGAFDLQGLLTKEKKRNLEEDLKNTKSIIWSGVVSFDEAYGNLHCRNRKQAQEIMNKSFETFANEQKLDINNLNFLAAFHINTDNPHIHFIYWEKEKTKLNSKGILCFSKNSVNEKNLANFKAKIAHVCSLQGKDFDFSLRDEIRKKFNKKNIEDKYLEKFKLLKNSLGEMNSIQYARITNDNKQKINDFIEDFVESNNELQKSWTTYINQLQKIQKGINKNYADNKIPLTTKAKDFSKNRIEELYSRCGNEILKTIKSLEEQKEYETPKRKQIFSRDKKEIHKGVTSKRKVKNLLSHLLSDKEKGLTNDIRKIIALFQQELLERGDIAIYE